MGDVGARGGSEGEGFARFPSHFLEFRPNNVQSGSLCNLIIECVETREEARAMLKDISKSP